MTNAQIVTLVATIIITLSMASIALWLKASENLFREAYKQMGIEKYFGFTDSLKMGFKRLSLAKKLVVLLEITIFAPLTATVLWIQYAKLRKVLA